MRIEAAVVDLRRRVAANLRRIRAKLKLTQEQVAERAGLATRHVQKLEAGAVNATFKTVAALARALGVDVSELCRRPGGKNPNAAETHRQGRKA